jgi:GT2 family glycosyltransferase
MIGEALELLGLETRTEPLWFMIPDQELEEFCWEARLNATSLERLCVLLRARRKIDVLVRSPRHWSTVLNLSHRQGDSESLLSLEITADPAEVRKLLFSKLYKITEAIATEADNPAITRPITEWLMDQGIEMSEASQWPRILEVRFSAEPVEPMIDEVTAGILGPATISGTSVVVLTYNSEETIVACLNSVLATLNEVDELIVVDNGSADRTVKLVSERIANRNNCKLIQNVQNLGFSAGCNVGLKASKGRYVTLLNPDTVVFGDWLSRLSSVFEDPFVAAVGPLSDNVIESQFIGTFVPQNDLKAMPLQAINHHVNELYGSHSTSAKLLIGFCLALRRSALDRIGLLDESMFIGSEDLEISLRLRTHGYRLRIAKGVFVHHSGGKSFRSQPTERTQRMLNESSLALKLNLESLFGESHLPRSEDVWDSPIFSHMIG